MTEIKHSAEGWPCWPDGPRHLCTTGIPPCSDLATWRVLVRAAESGRDHVSYYCNRHVPSEAFDDVRQP